MRARINGAWKEVSGGRVRVSGAWKNLTRIRAYVSGAWEDVATFTQPFTALTVTESLVRSGQPGDILTTGSSFAVATGGRAPFTYSWARVSGVTGVTINTPSAAQTTFSRLASDVGTFSAVFRCTATDGDGVARTDDTTVTFVVSDTTS